MIHDWLRGNGIARRMTLLRRVGLAAIAGSIGACQAGDPQAPVTNPRFTRIGPSETVRAIGTEPFWGTVIADGRATYTTPDDQDGTTLGVETFVGNNGISYSGTLNGTRFDLMVTASECSDGMSDRIYPFTATVQLGDVVRTGCAFTMRYPARDQSAN